MAKLLVVDDEPDIRDLVVKRLVAEGHQVLPAGSGPAALLLARLHAGVRPLAAVDDVDAASGGGR